MDKANLLLRVEGSFCIKVQTKVGLGKGVMYHKEIQTIKECHVCPHLMNGPKCMDHQARVPNLARQLLPKNTALVFVLHLDTLGDPCWYHGQNLKIRLNCF
jgi:hypothetical protein